MGCRSDLSKRSWAKEMTENELILLDYKQKSVDSFKNSDLKDSLYCEVKSITDGLILEIAVGPGAGQFSYILRIHPDKKILVNDIGAWIVREWERVNGNLQLGTKVSFAQFDIKYAPIKIASFDCFLCGGGKSSIPGVTRAKGVASNV